ncbi:MAG: Vgr family protein [Sphingobacteriales bacterium]|nr:MAG: Vgr family protein [Sphingobacteriales bacterium]
MFQDSEKKSPSGTTPGVKNALQQAGTQAATGAANEALSAAAAAGGEKAAAATDKAKQAAQTAQQVAAYAGTAQHLAGGLGSNSSAPNIGTSGTFAPSPSGLAGGDYIAPAVAQMPSVAQSFAAMASGMLGVSHLTQLKIVIDGQMVSHYKQFQLSQSATEHHHFTLVLGHDGLGAIQDHNLESVQKMLGKRITVTMLYRNITGSPERDFVGVVTKVGLDREFGNHGNIVIQGSSPTVLLDGACHIQSFGGTSPASLSSIAQAVMKEGMGDYDIRVDPQYGDLTYTCQYDETHYNFLARTAEAYGEQFFYDGKVLHFGKMPDGEQPIKLVFGRDVEEIDVSMNVMHVAPMLYGYNSKTDEHLSTGKSTVNHSAALGKEALSISEKVFTNPALQIAPLNAQTNKDIEIAQKSATGSRAVNVFTTSGRTTVPLLYPGCIIQMEMRKAGTKDSTHFTELMVIEVNHSVDTIGHYSGHFVAIGTQTGFMPKPRFAIPVAQPQVATVKSNTDPDNQGRVQVQFNWQSGESKSEFIRVASIDAGSSGAVAKNRGLVFIPEVEDQVMVGFMHNHPDMPYVMHAMFTGKTGSGGGDGNNIKSITMKGGSTITFDEAKQSITISDPSGNTVVLDGDGGISLSSPKSISLTSKDISIIASNSVTMNATNNISAGAKAVGVAASAGLALSGKESSLTGSTKLSMNSASTSMQGDDEVKIGGTAITMSGSGDVGINGALVKINS